MRIATAIMSAVAAAVLVAPIGAASAEAAASRGTFQEFEG